MSAVVLITGASTGFGRDAAERLARRGHRVFATLRDARGRNAASREGLEALARAERLALTVLEMDVTDDGSVGDAVGRVLDEAGRVDAVINNAAVAGIGLTEAYTPAQFQQMFDVNVCGAVRVNRAVLPSMRQRRGGLLIHVSSGAGRLAVPALAAYSASKFALEALADAYRYELQPFGVESVLVEPGIYATPIFDKMIAPADTDRLADYGEAAEYVDRVWGAFRAATGAPDAPAVADVADVADAFVRLVEAAPGERPFRTVVPAPIAQLLEGYNAMAAELRPVIAQIFNVPDRAEAPQTSVPA
jgi:NAD(P)-dependent dehydrogenase (short-subunit alcohol dehydrogenase family)